MCRLDSLHTRELTIDAVLDMVVFNFIQHQELAFTMKLPCLIISEAIALKSRPLGMDDAQDLFSLIDSNRAFLRPWLGWLDSTVSTESSRRFIASCIAHAEAKTGFTFGLFLNDRLMGMMSLDAITKTSNSTYSAKMGYWIGQDYLGKGIVPLALHKLIAFGIEQEINYFQIFCGTQNTSSQRVADKLMFKNVGNKQDAEWLYDHYVDHVIYAISSDEWSMYYHQLFMTLSQDCINKLTVGLPVSMQQHR